MWRIVVVATLFAVLCWSPLTSAQGGAKGVVASIDKAPVIADGDVQGQPTDYVITLEGSLDPSIPGRSLAAGDTISVIFPPEFDLGNLNPAYPLLDVPTPGMCTPGNLQCTTGVLLPGWPQNPAFPPAAFHTLSIDASRNAIVFTSVQNIVANPPVFPGVKQVHLILNGVENPRPGNYHVQVEFGSVGFGTLETGSGLLQVLPRARPSINITSVFAGPPTSMAGSPPPNPNTIYQTTAPGTPAPLDWSFLLWGQGAAPLDGVMLQRTGPNHWLMVQNGQETVGHVRVDAPNGGNDYSIVYDPAGFSGPLGAAPIIGGTLGIGPQPVARLDLQFVAGSAEGLYVTTLRLNNGNAVQMYVEAVAAP